VTEAYEAEESLKLVFEDNPVPMWLFDPETLKFLAVNDAALVHYGYDRETFLKLTLLDLVPQRARKCRAICSAGRFPRAKSQNC
jgi:PAS domain S-box-containing protein